MKITRYITLLALVLAAIVARGQGFNPDSPGEPAAMYRLRTVCSPAEAGTVTGTGYYKVNTKVSLRATAADTQWRFLRWEDENGTQLSTSTSYTYTTTNANATVTARFEYVGTSQLTLKSSPANLFTEKTTTYQVGQNVNVSCSSYSYYTFVHWTNSQGEVVSTSRSFSYTTTAEDETLTAHYRYTPSSPSEPIAAQLRHRVYFTSTPCSATFTQTSGFLANEGSTYSVTVHTPSSYAFDGWYDGDELVGTSTTYKAVMGDHDVHLTAHFHFAPGAPGEPSSSTRASYTLYGLTSAIYQGETMLIPIYMENKGYVRDLTFGITLPEGITADPAGVQTTSRTTAYTPVVSQDGQRLTVTLSGGTQIADTNGPVLMIPITASGCEDGEYAYTFSDIQATLVDNSQVSGTSRRGLLQVSTLEEGDLQAQFSVDRYMNRAQFTNLSSSEARSYLWDFGDGQTSTEENPMHIYAAPGSYTVTLTARAIVKTDVAEQSIVINPSTSWVASGDYTLDSHGTGVRNFTSLHQAIDLLGQCTPDGTIHLQVSDGGNYPMNLTHADSLALLSTLTGRLTAARQQMQLSADAPATLALNANAVTADLQTAVRWISQLQLAGVTVQLNGAPIEPALFQLPQSQTVCAQAATEAVPYGDYTNQHLTISWYATVTQGSQLSDYVETGTGSIPVMAVNNPGTRVDSVMYHVDYRLDGVSLYNIIYKVYVRPDLSQQTLSLTSPAQGSTVGFGQQTLRWTDLGKMAHHYVVTIQSNEPGAVVQEFTSNYAYIYFQCVAGKTYTWHVTAVGECDELQSAEGTFSVRQQSDLVVDNVTAPTDAQGLTAITVTATVRNQSQAETNSTSWYDGIYWALAGQPFSQAHYITHVSHNGRLAAGASYDVTFNVTTPEAANGTIIYYVVADDSQSESESNELNNRAASAELELINRYIADADYTALKALYHATNGAAWTTPWNINSNAVTTAAWRGVTFDEEGHVIAISLPSNNLRGSLPTTDFDLQHLTTLNLSGNRLNGDIAACTAQLTALTTLNLSNCQFSTLTEALPAHITSLNLGYQQADQPLSGMTCQQWTIGANMQEVELGQLLSYSHSAQDFTAHPTLQVRHGGNTVGRMTWNRSRYVFTGNNYMLANDTEVEVSATEGIAIGCRLRATLSWVLGDANIDATVDVLDAQQELNYILGRQSGNWNGAAANVYSDAIINVQDVVATINLFLAESSEVRQQRLLQARQRMEAEKQVTTAGSLRIQDDALWLTSSDEVAALDIELSGVHADQVSLALSQKRYQMIARNTQDGVRLVIVSPVGQTIAAGDTRLLRISGQATITSVQAADAQARRCMIDNEDNPTAIDGIQSQATATGQETLYDLAGRRISERQAMQHRGVYIVNGKKVLR